MGCPTTPLEFDEVQLDTIIYAVLLGLEDLKASKVTKPYAGQFPENVTPKRHLKEFRDFDGEVKVGDQIGVELFDKVRFIDVTATSKGKGFQGVMKRWGFHGGRATHGSKFHRHQGSNGPATTPSRVRKGKGMPGHMGAETVTTQNLQIVKVDAANNMILVKGCVPGPNKSLITLKEAVKASKKA
jgi:large subunit ribosomal protein L3